CWLNAECAVPARSSALQCMADFDRSLCGRNLNTSTSTVLVAPREPDMNATIAAVSAMEILDSRGNPSLRVFVDLRGGFRASASVPAGASTGTYEACELRDGDQKRYCGRGVLRAIANVTDIIAPKLIGVSATRQR